MADIVSRETRSRMMAGIRGKHTMPERVLRKALFARGLRYRLHGTELPGKPDLIFPRYHAAVFVNGCFWHGHACRLFKWPSTRKEFWTAKINGNRERDQRCLLKIRSLGWRAITVWECSLRGKSSEQVEQLADDLAAWIRSNDVSQERSGE
jgi:DNA mismatch endonuclease (patch repair protein)